MLSICEQALRGQALRVQALRAQAAALSMRRDATVFLAAYTNTERFLEHLHRKLDPYN